jgi:raffinose/stachyose/melibiose transport system permease protein
MTTSPPAENSSTLPARKSKSARAGDDHLRFLPWVFIAPALVIYTVIVVYPMIYSSYLSLFRWDGISPHKVFVGLQNYVILLTQNEVFWIALKNNAVWLVASLLLPTSIGLGFALILNSKFRGLLNQALSSAGLKSLTRNWLSDPQIALYPVIIAATWNAVGLPMLLFLAGLQTVPEELLEAAKIDGAGPIRRFLLVTFPLLRETTLIVLAINALKAYDIVYAMTNGGPANRTQLLSTWMYFLTYNYNTVGQGTAIAVILFAITLVFAIPYIRFMTRKS